MYFYIVDENKENYFCTDLKGYAETMYDMIRPHFH